MHAPPIRRRPRRRRPRTVLRLLLAVLVGLVAIGTTAAGSGPASAAAGAGEPLQVVLTSLSPSTVPTTGPLRVQGTVRNVSQQTWSTINVSAIASTSPMTTPAEVARAARTPVDAFVGNRFSTPSSFVAVGDLAPGDSTTFSLRIPRDELPIPDEAGVYWFGVHALASDDDGRGVEGRARTFIPVVTSPRSPAAVSVVVPFRQEVRRTLDFRVAGADALSSQLTRGGRLGRLLRLTETSGAAPVTLLLDPAVLSAAQSLGQGNPVRRTAAGATSGSDSDSDSAQGAVTPGDIGAVTARDWLSRIETQAQRNRVLGLGYADPDTAALATAAPGLLGAATTQARDAFSELGIDATATAAPPDGLLPLSTTSRLDPGTVLLLSDAAAPGRTSGTPGSTPSGQPVVVADSAGADGGPAPGPTTSALAVRQRIVSEAALRARDGDRTPLVVSLPADWDPGKGWRSADFFAGLQRPWLDLVPLDTSAGTSTLDSLRYPATARREQLGAGQVRAARSLDAAAQLYADTLSRPGDTSSLLQRLSLIAGSYHQRGDTAAPARTRALAGQIRSRLRGVKVVGNDFVTLSGGSGSIVVTLVNDLDQTTRVGLSARTASDLRIKVPGVITLPPGQRTTVPLRASSDNNGVRAVELTPVTAEGDAVGTPLRFSVRSSQVSLLVWAVMGAAGLLLVVMIVRRAVRRGLRREPGPPGTS